ncbi:MAG: ATP synthase F0 subunit B [Myxococcota bacterium]
MMLFAILSDGSLIDLDGTFFIQLAVFFTAFVVLRTLVFKPVLAVLEAREQATDGAREQAKQLQKEAAASGSDFEDKLRALRADAAEKRDALRGEGKRTEATLLAKVREDTEKQLAEAEARLASEAARLRSEVQGGTPALAKQIASKLLQREVS